MLIMLCYYAAVRASSYEKIVNPTRIFKNSHALFKLYLFTRSIYLFYYMKISLTTATYSTTTIIPSSILHIIYTLPHYIYIHYLHFQLNMSTTGDSQPRQRSLTQ